MSDPITITLPAIDATSLKTVAGYGLLAVAVAGRVYHGYKTGGLSGVVTAIVKGTNAPVVTPEIATAKQYIRADGIRPTFAEPLNIPLNPLPTVPAEPNKTP